jgi:UDP:flavonoid glycosyltransferase YjiC (YdhE family)
MSTIAICIMPVPSEIMSGVGFAKRLRRRGHRACIISTPEVGDAARAEGIEFVPVLADVFTAGSMHAQIQLFASLSREDLKREMRRAVRHASTILDGLLGPGRNEIERALERVAPDLVLIYSDTPYPAIAGLLALGLGMRCAYATPLFYQHRDPASPPLSSRLVPRPGARGRWSVRSAWARFLIEARLRGRLGIALGLDVDMPGYLRKLSRRAGGAGRPFRRDCFVAPMLRLPEFYLSPRDLDFPVGARDGCHWIGSVVDDERAEEPFPWERVDPSRPLVYCSFGTQLYAFLPRDRRIAFLQALIDALEARPRFQVALATGGNLEPGDLLVRAPDAIVMGRMPQLQVLRRAALMITHAGFNSVQECARAGVPMVAFPLGFDQPGNSARVVHHGLGVRGDVWRATAEDIGRLIDAAAGDEAMRGRCATLADLLRDQGRDEEGWRALEALAGRP